MNRVYHFRVDLSYQDFTAYYQGAVKFVVVRDDSGLLLQLPAARLRPFITPSGIHGRFELELDEHNATRRLVRLE